MGQPKTAADTLTAASAQKGETPGIADKIEEAILDSQARRHVLVQIDGPAVWIGKVQHKDRALRTPSTPIRPMVFESLLAFDGVVVLLHHQDQCVWEGDLTNFKHYEDAVRQSLERQEQPSVSIVIPRSSVLNALVSAAREVQELHAQKIVHGDLSPGNLLFEGGKLVSYDGLHLKAGDVAVAATFDWAAPEQVTAQPVDTGSDVYSLGKMANALVGGVPYGEESVHVIPTGGGEMSRVSVLKTVGVFIDITETEYNRSWQQAWQSFLSRCLAYDCDKRPSNGNDFADELASLIENHAIGGEVRIAGRFGRLCAVETDEGPIIGRVLED